MDWALPVHDIFNAFEDLEIPKVAAINGMALGGGFEMCLVCDYRVMSEAAQSWPSRNQTWHLPWFWWYGSFKPSSLVSTMRLNGWQWLLLKSLLLH